MKIRHLVFVGLLLVGAAVLLAACGGGPAASGDSPRYQVSMNTDSARSPGM